MPVTRVAPARLRLFFALACGLVTADLSGCGGADQEMQLTEQARKAVERRKVDVHERPARTKADAGGSRIPSKR